MSNPYKGGKYAAKNKQKIQEPEQNNIEPQKNGSIKSSGTVACFDWTESLVIAVVALLWTLIYIMRTELSFPAGVINLSSLM